MRVTNRVVNLVKEGIDIALRVRQRWTTAAVWWSGGRAPPPGIGWPVLNSHAAGA